MKLNRLLTAVAVLFATMAAVTYLVTQFTVWNHTSSLPQGLYAVLPCTPETGSIIQFTGNSTFRQLAIQRGYIAETDDFLKPVAATQGDTVCLVGGDVSINGDWVGRVAARDSQDRFLPRPYLCRALRKDELFVLSTTKQSYDGRYFGTLQRSEVKGCARLIWGAE